MDSFMDSSVFMFFVVVFFFATVIIGDTLFFSEKKWPSHPLTYASLPAGIF